MAGLYRSRPERWPGARRDLLEPAAALAAQDDAPHCLSRRERPRLYSRYRRGIDPPGGVLPARVLFDLPAAMDPPLWPTLGRGSRPTRPLLRAGSRQARRPGT